MEGTSSILQPQQLFLDRFQAFKPFLHQTICNRVEGDFQIHHVSVDSRHIADAASTVLDAIKKQVAENRPEIVLNRNDISAVLLNYQVRELFKIFEECGIHMQLQDAQMPPADRFGDMSLYLSDRFSGMLTINISDAFTTYVQQNSIHQYSTPAHIP